ncbi:hypothetical protein [Paraburkholderia sp. SIMBA_030]|uniref:hypothetical protein n=1 Tax=Paraburkholderia sp. SIMBA_030 TaxID=3085773 RepID=UPI00397A4D57
MVGLIDVLVARSATPCCILDQFYKFNATPKLHPLLGEGCNMQAIQLEVNYGKVLRTPTFRALADATDDPFMQPIVDLRSPKMVFGRAILLGNRVMNIAR